MGRAPCCSKVGLQKGAWSVREDKLLTDYILSHGEGKWKSLPTNAGLLRCGKSCRLRWMNYLRPGIKRGNITPEEDQLIIHFHTLLGNRWSQIAQKLPGRTDNEIKNHFNTHLRKTLDDSLPESTPVNMVSDRTKNSSKRKKKKDANKNKASNHSTLNESTQISLPDPNTTSSASLNTSSDNGGLTSGSSGSSITEVSNFSWPLIELDERSDCDDLLMDGCDLLITRSMSIDDDNNQELEKLYDEYLQLLN